VHTPCVNGCHFSGVSFFGALFLCVPYHDIKGGHTACLKVKHPAAGTKCLFSWIPGWMGGRVHTPYVNGGHIMCVARLVSQSFQQPSHIIWEVRASCLECI